MRSQSRTRCVGGGTSRRTMALPAKSTNPGTVRPRAPRNPGTLSRAPRRMATPASNGSSQKRLVVAHTQSAKRRLAGTSLPPLQRRLERTVIMEVLPTSNRKMTGTLSPETQMLTLVAKSGCWCSCTHRQRTTPRSVYLHAVLDIQEVVDIQVLVAFIQEPYKRTVIGLRHAHAKTFVIGVGHAWLTKS